MAPKASAAEEEQRRLNEIHVATLRKMDQDFQANAAIIAANLQALTDNAAAMNAARVAAIATHAQVTDTAPPDPAGTLPVSSIHIQYRTPGMPHEQIIAIWLGKFLALNVSLLLKDTLRDLNSAETEITSDGRIKVNNKGSRKDYTKASIWLDGFHNYCVILTTLHADCEPELQAELSRLQFKARKWFEHYELNSVINWVLSIHNAALLAGPKLVNSWKWTASDEMEYLNITTYKTTYGSSSNTKT